MNTTISLFIFAFIFIITLNGPVKMRKDIQQIPHNHHKQLIIPQKIFAAEIHLSRIPHQYWQHRLQMIKSMGFNALSLYIMWNFHQIQKGKFDYKNGDKNLIGFLDLSKKYNFKILFRPGPYVCAEWDFGGLPVRLLSIKDLEIRANNKLFLEQVQIYFKSLVQIINKNRQIIVLLQIQNEYGSFGSDMKYIQAIRNIWKEQKIDSIPQYHVDGFNDYKKSHWQGANIGINNGIIEKHYTETRKIQPNAYILGGQIYSGWLTHWGEKWAGKTLQLFKKQFEFLMTSNHSFSMYMAHGGTNFGLTAGANSFQKTAFDYGAHVTSYDYDAPINQQGSPNEKFFAFKQLAKKHATWVIPEKTPQSIKTITINSFLPVAFADLIQNLPKPQFKDINELIRFEDLRLKMWNQGFIAYQTSLNPGKYQVNLTVHDFALIYINGQYLTSANRGQKIMHTINFQVSNSINKILILVEAMGHINYNLQMREDFKGIMSFKAKINDHKSQQLIKVQQNKKNIKQQKVEEKILESSNFKWTIYKIPITNQIFKWTAKSTKKKFPRLFRYNLTLQQLGDTYLNMQKWTKGYVFVNGYNLGRYWNKGPQKKLYLPGVWLKKGVNQVVILQCLMGDAQQIKGDKTLK